MSEWVPFGSAIAGAIIGGGITGFCTFKAVTLVHKNDIKLEKKKESSLIEGLLQAYHDEIETVWGRYQNSMGTQLEALPNGTPLLLLYPLFSDYFTIYHSNASIIGKIDDHDLRKEIVSFYTAAKGLVDSYRLNNELVQKYEYWEALYQESNNDAHKQKAIASYQILIAYADAIRKLHEDIKEKKINLLKTLRQNLT
ncbi:hypothetical protein MNBD_DELTA01-321 [hydrothermal vent metagenome]|uniref:Uncharacterized protein n=1 Tax=hydrothermal vent metagenome TaxID=652676 RepID=A0A3B0QYI1_9ZZZZ